MSKKVTFTEWDQSKYLETEEDIVDYLTEVFEGGDPAVIRIAINDVAKARYMTDLAKKMGIERSELYNILSDETNLEFTNVQKLLNAVGVYMNIISRAGSPQTMPAV